MVAVAYGRWSFTRVSNCEALTVKVLMFWIGGLLWGVAAHACFTVPATDVIQLTLTTARQSLLTTVLFRTTPGGNPQA